MLKITEKVTRYDIEDLNEADYSILKHLVMCSERYGLPSLSFAYKILKIEDVCQIYQVTEEYIEKNAPKITR